MKAAVYRRYGPPNVVTIEEMPTPEPKHDEVLVRIHATTVGAGDWRARTLSMPKGFGPIARLVFGVSRPRQPILGTELAGEIAAVGAGVTKFKAGDPVFAYPALAMGCHAEYRTMPENGRIALKPPNLTFAEAAALCSGGATALYYLRDRARIQRGDSVLVIGASGEVGSAAVQIAKSFGTRVTGVSSAANLALVTSIGADRVIDYAQEDFTESGDRYDIICDTVGTMSFAACKNALKPGGRLLLIAADLPRVVAAAWARRSDSKRVLAGPASDTHEHVLALKALAESGRFTPVIDAYFPLERIADAHARVDTRRKRGSVVVTVTDAARSRSVAQ